MKFPHSHGARFIQIYELGNKTVYRLLLPENLACTPEDIAVTSRGRRISARILLLENPDSTTPGGSVLSITLDDAETRFCVRRRGRRLATMSPARYQELVVRRNLMMVNPAIDGAFGDYLLIHDRMLHAASAMPLPPVARPIRFSIIVPLYRTPIRYAHDMIHSVLAQSYQHWELILVNASPDDTALARELASHRDERIRIVDCAENRGIAGNTNIGIASSTGDYLSFLDHDDMLDPHVLEFYARAIAERPEIDLLYCDEDNFRETLDDRYAPIFKPDFNKDLLYSHNYVEHFLTVSRRALEQVELSPDDVSGAQDYDLTLKVCEIARAIVHIPFLLYHWRAHPGSTNGGDLSGKPYAVTASINALNRHFERIGIEATAHETHIPCVFRISYRAPQTPIAVIIPFRTVTAVRELLATLVPHVKDTPCTIFVVGPQRVDDRTVLVPWNDTYDEVAMIQAAIPHLGGIDWVMICTESVRFTSPDCIRELHGCPQRQDVGIVAPRLLYTDDLIQHAGICFDEHNIPHFINQGFSDDIRGGYLGLAACCCAYGAVGPDCFMLRTKDLDELYNPCGAYRRPLAASIDLSLAIRSTGRQAVVLPDITATVQAPIVPRSDELVSTYHLEHDMELLIANWGALGNHEPLRNQHVSLVNGYPNLAVGRNIEQEAQRLIKQKRRAFYPIPTKGFLK